MGIVILGALLILYEAPSFCRQERYRDLAVFLTLTVLSLILSILLLLDIPIGNPTTLIKTVGGFLWEMYGKIGGILGG
ncbi:MAG: hypothetical protein GX989_05750 [Firmicutes bacterium]|nr:hypothetical protein [Bacillota bacterium]